jgi:hypothetical protein
MAECGVMPATFFEMLASTLVKDANGETFFNIDCYSADDCNALEPAIECGEEITDLEAFIVSKGFGTDACGRPTWKMRICTSERQE